MCSQISSPLFASHLHKCEEFWTLFCPHSARFSVQDISLSLSKMNGRHSKKKRKKEKVVLLCSVNVIGIGIRRCNKWSNGCTWWHYILVILTEILSYFFCPTYVEISGHVELPISPEDHGVCYCLGAKPLHHPSQSFSSAFPRCPQRASIPCGCYFRPGKRPPVFCLPVDFCPESW